MSGHRSIPDVPLCLSTPFDIGGVVDAAINLLFSKAAGNMPKATFSGIVCFFKCKITQEFFAPEPTQKPGRPQTIHALWETSLPHCHEGEKKSIVIFDLVEYF